MEEIGSGESLSTLNGIFILSLSLRIFFRFYRNFKEFTFVIKINIEEHTRSNKYY